MPTFILAGVQRSLGPRVKAALERDPAGVAGWTAVTMFGKANGQSQIGREQVDELMRLAEERDGAHIFGVSAVKDRREIEDLVRPHFRFRWFDPAPVNLVGRGDETSLLAALAAALAEEDYWLTNVKPSSSASPLALPPIFSCQRDLADTWRLAESYNNRGHLETAAKRIAKFTNAHRRRVDGFKNTPWNAEDGWIWDDDGARHGNPEFPMDWKYSLRLPDGFHFDVSPKAKGKTYFADRFGGRHSFKTHVNVTAHGTVRGASETDAR